MLSSEVGSGRDSHKRDGTMSRSGFSARNPRQKYATLERFRDTCSPARRIPSVDAAHLDLCIFGGSGQWCSMRDDRWSRKPCYATFSGQVFGG